MPENRKRSNTGCLWAIIVLQAGVLLLVILALLGIGAVRTRMAAWKPAGPQGGVDEYPPMREVWARGEGTTKVVSIAVKGTLILDEDVGLFASAMGTADHALASIRRATTDNRVRGIILDVDSGGGGITASDVLYNALLEFKASRPDRVVVAIFGDVAASGAYYVAAAADHIVARPTSITGSIGVMMRTLNVRELSEKIGVRDVTIKSGENKDLLNPFEDVDPQQRALLQDVVDAMHGRFVGIVARGRDLAENRVRTLADGRIYTAEKALELGLLDEIGYWDEAMARTAELLDVPKIKVFRYEREFSLGEILRAEGPGADLRAALEGVRSPRLWYVWQP